MPKQKSQKPFSLPEENLCGTVVVSYLRQRGIDADIISHCIAKGLLYESRHYRNCVFVGRDAIGKARYSKTRDTYKEYTKSHHKNIMQHTWTKSKNMKRQKQLLMH